MKKFTKLLGIVLIIALVMSMGTMALADETTGGSTTEGGTDTPVTHKITNNSTNHTYEVYQIFTGKYDATTKQLQNLKYGQNAVGTTGSAVTAADLKKLADYTDAGTTQAQDQKDIAFISQFVNLTGDPIATIDAGGNITVPEGYYLIKDKDNSLANTDEQYTLYLVSILNEDITITPKTGTTTSEKKVDDINDSTGTAENKQDSADYDIGDYVPFHLTAHMAQNVNAYKQYHLTFTDTLESGKFDAITTPVIKVDGTELSAIASTAGYTAEATYTTAATKDGFVVTITFKPIAPATLLPEALNGKDVTIDFTAQLGEGANIGQEGNVNTLQLKYSNNPNSEDDSEEGTNPEDTVIVFTYNLVVNKQDEDKAELKGASFALYKKYATVPTDKEAAESPIKYAGETKSYTIPTGTNYVLVKEISGTDASTFTFSGIDDGDYLLVETVVPTGYNPLEPKTFTVSATHTATADINKETKKDGNGAYVLTGVSGTGEITLAQHTKEESEIIDGVSTDVINQSGTVLPSTGGIGTTIFYVVGSILVVAAGVLLITKKRMSREG